MPREVEPSLNEKAFVLQALQENLRLDGRQFDQYRTLELAFGEQHGVADVKLGRTRYEDHIAPATGILMFDKEYWPMSRPRSQFRFQTALWTGYSPSPRS